MPKKWNKKNIKEIQDRDLVKLFFEDEDIKFGSGSAERGEGFIDFYWGRGLPGEIQSRMHWIRVSENGEAYLRNYCNNIKIGDVTKYEISP